MVKVCVGPVQAGVPFEKEGVTVIIAVIGLAVAFVTLKVLMFPVPDAGNPIAVLELVQLYVVVPPVVLVEKITAVVLVPLHKI